VRRLLHARPKSPPSSHATRSLREIELLVGECVIVVDGAARLNIANGTVRWRSCILASTVNFAFALLYSSAFLDFSTERRRDRSRVVEGRREH
jgi:hypothetical protein